MSYLEQQISDDIISLYKRVSKSVKQHYYALIITNLRSTLIEYNEKKKLLLNNKLSEFLHNPWDFNDEILKQFYDGLDSFLYESFSILASERLREEVKKYNKPISIILKKKVNNKEFNRDYKLLKKSFPFIQPFINGYLNILIDRITSDVLSDDEIQLELDKVGDSLEKLVYASEKGVMELLYNNVELRNILVTYNQRRNTEFFQFINESLSHDDELIELKNNKDGLTLLLKKLSVNTVSGVSDKQLRKAQRILGRKNELISDLRTLNDYLNTDFINDLLLMIDSPINDYEQLIKFNNLAEKLNNIKLISNEKKVKSKNKIIISEVKNELHYSHHEIKNNVIRLFYKSNDKLVIGRVSFKKHGSRIKINHIKGVEDDDWKARVTSIISDMYERNRISLHWS